MLRGSLQHIKKCRDKSINSTTQILQIDDDHIACAHHLIAGPSDLAIKTEDGHAMCRINEGGRFNHIVLLVAANAVLRAENCADVQISAAGQGI